ncbi:PsbP-like protein 1 [Rhynchospora pubera]|uniref:PsbP-like protein 1 n=1 Tax=Rhynchospora pubera TaxID=906938 RepID=A0AAV8F5U8_9POAL|nr:PsbP-like protein 1 [Rhynchospora pubera]
MACLANSSSVHGALLLNRSAVASTSYHQLVFNARSHKRKFPLQIRADSLKSETQDKLSRRQILTLGAVTANLLILQPNQLSFAAEVKKGFLPVSDQKDGYFFLYPFGWQEVIVEGQDKVLKDVIEPLESVSVNLIPTSKQDIRELGPPQVVAETLVKKVLAPSSQKTKLIEASEHDVDGKAYYTFEFIAQAPNFTRHALGTVSIANGKFYTLTTGANERRWGKMKDILHEVVDSFKIETR